MRSAICINKCNSFEEGDVVIYSSQGKNIIINYNVKGEHRWCKCDIDTFNNHFVNMVSFQRNQKLNKLLK